MSFFWTMKFQGSRSQKAPHHLALWNSLSLTMGKDDGPDKPKKGHLKYPEGPVRAARRLPANIHDRPSLKDPHSPNCSCCVVPLLLLPLATAAAAVRGRGSGDAVTGNLRPVRPMRLLQTRLATIHGRTYLGPCGARAGRRNGSAWPRRRRSTNGPRSSASSTTG